MISLPRCHQFCEHWPEFLSGDYILHHSRKQETSISTLGFLKLSSPDCVDPTERKKERAVSRLHYPKTVNPHPILLQQILLFSAPASQMSFRNPPRLGTRPGARSRDGLGAKPRPAPPAHAQQRLPLSLGSTLSFTRLRSFVSVPSLIKLLTLTCLSGGFLFLIPSAATWCFNHVVFPSL